MHKTNTYESDKYGLDIKELKGRISDLEAKNEDLEKKLFGRKINMKFDVILLYFCRICDYYF